MRGKVRAEAPGPPRRDLRAEAPGEPPTRDPLSGPAQSRGSRSGAKGTFVLKHAATSRTTVAGTLFGVLLCGAQCNC
jgi:hypothetical protein